MRRGLILIMGAVVAMTLGMGLAACSAPASSSGSASGASSSSAAVESGSASASDSGTASDASSTSSAAQSSSASSDDSTGVSINLADNSILKFDGNEASAQLVADMREGKAPVSCTLLYDQEGTLPTVTVNDAREMRKIYSELAGVHVEGETDESATDSYHLISFELQDGTTATFNFEGDNILVRDGKNYRLSNQDGLWAYVRGIQGQYLDAQSTGDGFPAITLDDEEELIMNCPKSAPAGETVQVRVMTLLDADLHLSVNGDEDFGKFVSAEVYEFVMPDSPVTVRAWSVTEPWHAA